LCPFTTDEDGIRTAPPLTVGTDLEDHPAAPESTLATPIHPAAPESTPATSSHPMDINMSECVAPIEPSTEFGSIATPSVPIAHVEMTSTGPNQTCSHIKLSYLRRPFGKGKFVISIYSYLEYPTLFRLFIYIYIYKM
jgi:hypothetical protein